MTPVDVEVETEDARAYRLAAAEFRRKMNAQTNDLVERGRMFEAWRQQWLEAQR